MRFLGLIAAATMGLSLVAGEASAAWSMVSGASTVSWIAAEPTAERHVWKVNNGNVYEYGGGTTWTQRGGAGLNAWQITLPNDPNNNKNTPWILNSSGQVRKWNGTAFGTAFPVILGTSIAVSGDTPWVIGNDTGTYGASIYRYNATTSTWEQPVPEARASQIAVDSAGTPWCLNAQGTIYRWTGTNWGTALPGAGIRLSGGAVFGTQWDFIYFANSLTNPTGWNQAAPIPPTFVGNISRAGNVIWAVGDASELYRWQ